MMRIIAIGAVSNKEKKRFSGQSIMFDGIIDKLSEHGDFTSVIDISPKIQSGSVLFRSVDYFQILIKLFFKLIFNKWDVGYITTSQSKNGFIRDYLIIGLCKLFKVKVVAHQYGANYNQLLQSLNDKGMKRLTNMLDYVSIIIVEGQYMKEQYSFLPNYNNKVFIIPNGLPSVGESALKAKHYEYEMPFKVFYLSNLIWSKGYFDVLKAADILVNERNRNVEFIFAGTFMSSADDPQPGISNAISFKAFIKEHRLESVVKYYPGLYGKEKDEAFALSNVFVLPTYYINEGQPVSIIEAMAYGCVPVVTEYRHIPMMVTNDNGCFVKPQNPEQIADVIIKLMNNPVEYSEKSQACIQDYLEKFTFDKYTNRVIDCMNKAAN